MSSSIRSPLRWLPSIPALLVAASWPPVVPAQAETGVQTIVSGGVERSYLLYVPESYRGDPVPLVLNFHGSGGVPDNQRVTSAFDALAEREGFAVAFPAGAFTNSLTARSWNANLEPGVDDVRFARDVIADAAAKISIDESRIYATGFSGGGRMSSRLACELADTLAAAAPVAGLQYPTGCTPARAVPLMSFHGKADQVNHYELGDDARPYWRMGVETAVAMWREAIGCTGDPGIAAVAPGVELRRWSACRSGAEIRFYVIEDGGHVWPEDASELIWAFFEGHRL
jgi:polyhydroxybutyrate depolymerase